MELYKVKMKKKCYLLPRMSRLMNKVKKKAKTSVGLFLLGLFFPQPPPYPWSYNFPDKTFSCHHHLLAVTLIFYYQTDIKQSGTFQGLEKITEGSSFKYFSIPLP